MIGPEFTEKVFILTISLTVMFTAYLRERLLCSAEEVEVTWYMVSLFFEITE